MLDENAEKKEKEFEYPRRRQPRKVNYGKCKVDIAGGEAAPYEIFIGNTNPASTEEKIGEVLKKCADLLPEDQKLAVPLQVLKITCLSKANENGEPLRTKCCKVQVPNMFREHMLKDIAYPSGWSHRRFFPKKIQKSVPPVDPHASEPKRQHLSVAAEDAPNSLG